MYDYKNVLRAPRVKLYTPIALGIEPWLEGTDTLYQSRSGQESRKHTVFQQRLSNTGGQFYQF